MTEPIRSATLALVLLVPAACATAGRAEPTQPQPVVEPSGTATVARTTAYEPDGDAVEGGLVRPEGAERVASVDVEVQRLLDHAEQLFLEADVPAAREAYLAVLAARPERSVQGYALYKLAWSEINLQELTSALQHFVELLSLLNPPLDERERTLRREAVKDMSVAFALGAEAERADAFFRRILRPEEVEPALGRLAEQYELDGRLDDARTVRNALRARTAP
jgi:hypothetical protein